MQDETLRRVDDQKLGRILVVEPDPLMLTAISACLDQQGHQITMAKSEDIAVRSIQDGDYDLLVLSIASIEAGCDLASRLRNSETTAQLPVIYMMENLAEAGQTKLARHGGLYCLQIPFQPDTLVELVERALWLPHIANSKLLSSQAIDPSLGAAGPSQFTDWISL